MIDLSPMKGIRVDPLSRRVRAEAGVLWGEIDREDQAFGLAFTGGQLSHTGIAGLTLGGGIGWLMRKHGLSCDNLLSADMVTAEGDLVHASASENPDLFWGLRGGSGNFGIVTSFEYTVHPLGPVLGGLVAFPLPEARQVLQGYPEYIKTAPDQLGTTVAFMTSPEGHPAVAIAVCYAGDPDAGVKVVEPITKLGTAVMEQIGPMPYPAVQAMLDEAAPLGRRYYVKAAFLDGMDAGAIDALAGHFSQVPSPLSIAVLVHMQGAVSRVDPNATASCHRSAAYSLSIIPVWTDPADDEKNISWGREMYAAVEPFTGAGVYVNELGEDVEERLETAYGGDTYRRLVELKRKYDPTNFFHLNPNISPG